MIELKSEINFNKHFKIFNIISIVLIIISVFFSFIQRFKLWSGF